MYALAVLDVKALVHIDEVGQLDTEVIPSNLVNLDTPFFNVVGAQTNEDGVSPLLAPLIVSSQSITVAQIKRGIYEVPDDDGITAEELKSLHSHWVQGSD